MNSTENSIRSLFHGGEGYGKHPFSLWDHKIKYGQSLLGLLQIVSYIARLGILVRADGEEREGAYSKHQDEFEGISFSDNVAKGLEMQNMTSFESIIWLILRSQHSAIAYNRRQICLAVRLCDVSDVDNTDQRCIILYIAKPGRNQGKLGTMFMVDNVEDAKRQLYSTIKNIFIGRNGRRFCEKNGGIVYLPECPDSLRLGIHSQSQANFNLSGYLRPYFGKRSGAALAGTDVGGNCAMVGDIGPGHGFCSGTEDVDSMDIEFSDSESMDTTGVDSMDIEFSDSESMDTIGDGDMDTTGYGAKYFTPCHLAAYFPVHECSGSQLIAPSVS